MTQPFEDIQERLEEIINDERALYRIGTAYDADVSRLLSAVDALMEVARAAWPIVLRGTRPAHIVAETRDALEALPPELKEALK